MRLTDAQIRVTVAQMRTGDDLKAVLLAKALAGDPGALLVVKAATARANESDTDKLTTQLIYRSERLAMRSAEEREAEGGRNLAEAICRHVFAVRDPEEAVARLHAGDPVIRAEVLAAVMWFAAIEDDRRRIVPPESEP